MKQLGKSADKEIVSQYQIAFEKYFLKSLTSRLKDYSSSNFLITGFDQKSSNYTIVNSKIVPEDGKLMHLHVSVPTIKCRPGTVHLPTQLRQNMIGTIDE